eukprot:NODE_3063_length_1286_cov_98.727429_g2908_i0.p1 GENE.NODE_3063_length_1286_cov_98.727429_g2908_i0~~NODE_3063_length_1286_cov_98.727429_g2908_i0.p1  ORF type:complete len:328 (-),score=36.41 NODE_3063_length_1286_cov_98.727429_g2908_i0:144-1127(-)
MEGDALTSFIQRGPLYGSAVDPKQAFSLATWQEAGDLLSKSLGDESTPERIYWLYLPIYFWLLRLREAHLAAPGKPDGVRKPLVIGLSCPQGGGKTTLTNYLQELLGAKGITCAVASLDDFYVTREEQSNIANANAGNPLLQYRGNPGTQDLGLCLETLRKLSELGTAEGKPVPVPRFDKSAYGGLGDRAPVSTWPVISNVVDFVIIEGWCMGFTPASEEALHIPNLIPVNRALGEFAELYNALDAMLVVQLQDIQWVHPWRLEAEHKMIASGKPGMSDAEVEDFVSRFMPAYRQFTPQLYSQNPIGEKPLLRYYIDRNRVPCFPLQ